MYLHVLKYNVECKSKYGLPLRAFKGPGSEIWNFFELVELPAKRSLSKYRLTYMLKYCCKLARTCSAIGHSLVSKSQPPAINKKLRNWPQTNNRIIRLLDSDYLIFPCPLIFSSQSLISLSCPLIILHGTSHTQLTHPIIL